MQRFFPTLLALALLATAALSADAAGAAPPASAAPAPLVVRSAGGSKSFAFAEKGGTVAVALPSGERLVGEPAGEKRTYRRASGGGAVYEVKPGESGFKVRTADGKLLWKVKLADDKIKVSDNQENRNPWSLKTKYDDKVKVVDASEKEVAEVKFYPDRTKVKDASGKELWECGVAKRTAAFGVLALETIPEEQRAVLAAEILARGR